MRGALCDGRVYAGQLRIQFFEVPFIGARGGWSDELLMSEEGRHHVNLAYYRRLLNDKVEWLQRNWGSRYMRDDRVMEYITPQVLMIREYADWVGVKAEPISIDLLVHDVLLERKRRRDRYFDPKNVAKREREAARKEALEALAR